MKIGISATYAFLAVSYIARNKDKKRIVSQTISEKYDIPLEYLRSVLVHLVRFGILRSKRGPNGGFTLLRPANKITMLDIIEATEGPLTNGTMEEFAQGDRFTSKIDKVYEQAARSLKNALKAIKL